VTREELLARVQEYLCLGGLWNPELVCPQDAVRDLIMDLRDYIERNPGPN